MTRQLSELAAELEPYFLRLLIAGASSSALAGQMRHGDLLDLDLDQHLQYLTTGRGDLRYSRLWHDLDTAHTGLLPWTRIDWAAFDIDALTPNDLQPSDVLFYGLNGHIDGVPKNWDGTSGNVVLETDFYGNIKVNNVQLPTWGLVDNVNISDLYDAFTAHQSETIAAAHSGDFPWGRIGGKPVFGWDVSSGGVVAQSDIYGRLRVADLLLPDGGAVDGVDISVFWSNYLDHTGRTIDTAHAGQLPVARINWSGFDIDNATPNDLQPSDVLFYGLNGHIDGVPKNWDGTGGFTLLETDSNGSIMVSHIYMPSGGTVDGVDVSVLNTAHYNHTSTPISSAHSGLLSWTSVDFSLSDVTDLFAYGAQSQVLTVGPGYSILYESPTWVSTSGSQLLRTLSGRIRLLTIEATNGHIFSDQIVDGNLSVAGKAGIWWAENFTAATGWGRVDGQMKKFGDHVFLRGRFTRSSGTASLVATLPVGFRPYQEQHFIQPGHTDYRPVHLWITAGGDIHATASGVTLSAVTLDGIIFSINGETNT